MSGVYAKVGDSFQQFGGECPQDWIEMIGPRLGEGGSDFVAAPDGTWIPAPEDQVFWRAIELAVIERQLQAIEEDDADETPTDLLPGTRKQWLKYRGLVSNWKEGAESFPDITHRPVRPS